MLRVRSVLLALLGLLYVASWPGAALRPLVVELTAAPLPEDIGDRDGALDVVVREAGGERPIEGARVRAFAILDGRAHSAGEARTDDGGHAALRKLPRAEHWVVAEAPGRARASRLVVVVGDARRLDLELGAEHSLEVEVRTEQGEPVVAAEIETRGGDPFPVGARTDAAGRARVGRLGEGPYVVVVRAAGFEEVTRRRVPEGERLVVTLGRKATLLVHVVGEGGRPAGGARVLVTSPSLWPARVAETGQDGSVRIGGLDAGTYALRAVQGSRVSPIEVGVALARGEEREARLELVPGRTIVARVIDAVSSDPVAHARVTLAEAGLSPFPIEGVTDKSGRVALGPVAGGAATLSARADGFVGKGAVRVADPAPPEVEIALVRGGALVGRVVDARGFPIDGATVRVVGTDLEGMPIDEDPMRASFREAHFAAALSGPAPLVPAGELGVMPGPVPPIPHGPALGLAAPGGAAPKDEPWITARDGTYRAAPVPPGRVRALVRHPQYVEAMSEVVSLAADGEAKVDVVLSRGGVLEGRVRDARGRPVSGAVVTILATRGSLERTARVASDGTFAFASVPEALTVLVSRDDDLLSVAARTEVNVPEGGRKTIELTLPEPREPLPVRVTAGRGDPVDAAQVSAVSLDATEALRVTSFTDRRGQAALKGALGLPLRVEVHAPGRATKIVVTTAETKELVVELGAGETLTGEVWANRRETIEGAEVVLHTETGTHRARTDKEGAFTLRDVSPGPAKLRVRAKERAPVERDVLVEDRGGRRPIELGRLELPEAGTVEGVVVDGRGDPVPGARVARDAVPTYLPVGALPPGMAVADGKGRFRLGELPEGTVTLEAYAPDVGRARVGGVRVVAGRTTDRVRILLARGEASPREPAATGGVAVTLGETEAGPDGVPDVVVVAVAEASEAERAGLLANDVLTEIGGARPRTLEEARARLSGPRPGPLEEARARLSGPLNDDVVVKVRRADRDVVLRVSREQVRR